jgi:heptosyltransferase-2
MGLENKQIKNILILRNDRFGEFLLNIPALRALRESFRDATIIAVVSPYVKELAQNISYVDEIIEWTQEAHGLREKLYLISSLKKRKIDIAVMLNPSKELNIITYLSGIPVRVGYNRKCGFLLTHRIKDEKHLGFKHEVEYNLELVSLVGAKTQDRSLFLEINNDTQFLKKFGLDISNNLIALHPWTSDPIKQWPTESFLELANKLLAIPSVKLVIIGGKEEVNKSRELFNKLDNRLIDLTGRTSLVQLGSVLKKCRLLVSCDSGPVHLATSVGTKVLAIFRNDIPGKTAKRWGPWGKGHLVIEKPDLSQITVDEVFSKIKEAIE